MRLPKSPWQGRDGRDVDLDDEIRAHFAMAVRDRIARGESPRDAEAAARREFGNVGHVKEVTREMWGGVWLERLIQDIRFAFRSLRRTPGFTIVATLTLALGIGANAAMFTVLNSVLLRPLPFANADQLYVASYKAPRTVFAPNPAMYDAHYVELEKNDPIFERLATYAKNRLTITGVGDPLRVAATRATPGLFPVLGVRPQLGRAFDDADAADDGGRSVILSDALWRRRFNADQRVVGTSVMLEGVPRTVVGVMPASFDFPAGTDVWLPWRVTTSPNQVSLIPVLGRLKPGLTHERAQQMFSAAAAHFTPVDDARREDLIAEVVPLKTTMVGDVRTPLFIFAGAIAFVLLIACANVANLLLMRMSSRDREMALRTALGAGRWRIIRQLLTETLTLTTIGALAGIGVAVGALQLLLSLAPPGMLPRAGGIRIDPWTLLFTAGLSLITALVCGVVPALHASENHLHASLTAGARTIAGGHQRIRSMLVIGEIAIALVLLTGAGLLVRSFHRMQTVDLGFEPRNTYAVTVDLPSTRYRTGEQMRAFHSRVLANLAAIPGVDAVGAINWRPLGGAMMAGNFTIENGPAFPKNYLVDKNSVSPGYFRAMGIRVERGRDFTSDDRAGAQRVVILSHSVAAKLWSGGDAVGKRISMSDKPTAADWVTVVGIVNDVVQNGVTSSPDAASYVPIDQTNQQFFLGHVTFVLRPNAGAADAPIASTAGHVLREADPNLAIETVTPMADLVANTTREPRFQSRVLLTFSLAALALAVIGIYGVLSYGVAQRQQEIGVRIALGATPGDVMRMVIRRTTLLAIPGILAGLAVSFALTRVLGRFLFQVTTTDPATFALVALALGVVALAAAAIPARRAGRVDPAQTLNRG
jgi:putative ABC transport system permease protein